MAYRVTAAEVTAIMDDVTLADAVIESFISAANAMVTNYLATTALDDATLKEIERWLSAHMVASTVERMAISEGAGGASTKYVGEFKQNLSATPYGQMVLMLDTTGKLTVASENKKQASVYAVTSFDD